MVRATKSENYGRLRINKEAQKRSDGSEVIVGVTSQHYDYRKGGDQAFVFKTETGPTTGEIEEASERLTKYAKQSIDRIDEERRNMRLQNPEEQTSVIKSSYLYHLKFTYEYRGYEIDINVRAEYNGDYELSGPIDISDVKYNVYTSREQGTSINGSMGLQDTRSDLENAIDTVKQRFEESIDEKIEYQNKREEIEDVL